MRKIQIIALAIFLLGCLQMSSAGDPSHRMLSIDVMDPRLEISQNINDHLLLRLRSAGDHEWEVQVINLPTSEFPSNLLYESGHGPDPTQIFAWNVASKRFPNERTFCVPGYPYKVVIRIKDAETRTVGQDIYFVRGKIEAEWFDGLCK